MLKNSLRALKRRTQMALLRWQWNRNAQPPAAADVSSPIARLLLMPADPWTLTGSKGDEAMMTAVVAQLRHRVPDLEVGVITASPAAAAHANRLGYVPVAAWSPWLVKMNSRIDTFQPEALIVLGADVMDGYYDPAFTMRVLLMADAAARRGVRVTVLGFSFNGHPNTGLRPVFDRLSRAIAFHVRDQVSLDRFRKFSTTPAELVADAAFLLEPDPSTDAVRAVRQWVGRRRAAGDTVIGFNIHPMLITRATPQQVDRLIATAVAALQAVARQRPTSFLLIPHDYRGGSGDAACLGPIHELLAPSLGENIMLVAGRHSAAQLKAIAGLVDGLVTGRMHLAIAGLGMGRPVAAMTYQDKFHGLFDHFNLPRRFLLAPEGLTTEGKLEALVLDFIDSLPELEQQVAQRVASVRTAAFRNLAPLGCEDPCSVSPPQLAPPVAHPPDDQSEGQSREHRRHRGDEVVPSPCPVEQRNREMPDAGT